MNLINRIKNAVKEQDHSQYGRLRRLICMDANGHLNEENVEGIETQNEVYFLYFFKIFFNIL